MECVTGVFMMSFYDSLKHTQHVIICTHVIPYTCMEFSILQKSQYDSVRVFISFTLHLHTCTVLSRCSKLEEAYETMICLVVHDHIRRHVKQYNMLFFKAGTLHTKAVQPHTAQTQSERRKCTHS